MSATTMVELELPTHTITDQHEPLQRTVIRHLLYDERITMAEALGLLAPEDQAWLVETILFDVQKNLSLIAQLTDAVTIAPYWQQSNTLLGYLLLWREKWTPFHGQLLALLRMVFRRYAPEMLTAKQIKLLSGLIRRLSEELLYREDIFAVTKTLKAEGLDPHLNLMSTDHVLLNAYLEELGRA